jgi:hypothetical protein
MADAARQQPDRKPPLQRGSRINAVLRDGKQRALHQLSISRDAEQLEFRLGGDPLDEIS